MDHRGVERPDITPGVVDGEELAWNADEERCADCGRRVEPQSGYKLYADGDPIILCASCYQRRLTAEAGGQTHDLTAEVDGGSG